MAPWRVSGESGARQRACGSRRTAGEAALFDEIAGGAVDVEAGGHLQSVKTMNELAATHPPQTKAKTANAESATVTKIKEMPMRL